MIKKTFLLFSLIALALTSLAQTEKKALTFDDILKWHRITEKQISDNGDLLVYKAEPWKGDPLLYIEDLEGGHRNIFRGGTSPYLAPDGSLVVFSILPTEDATRTWKLNGKNEAEKPFKKLAIFSNQQQITDSINHLEKLINPEKWSGWIAYLLSPEEKTDTTKAYNQENGYVLSLHHLPSGTIKKYPYVTDVTFSEDGLKLGFVSTGDKQNDFDAGLYQIDLENEQKTHIVNGKLHFANMNWNKKANVLAFVADTSAKSNGYELFLWKDDKLNALVNNSNEALPQNWEVSNNGKVHFSPSGNRIFIGIAPKPAPKDTTVLEEEVPVLDVWHWNEPTLHSQQLNTLDRDLKKSYTAVYDLRKNRLTPLEKKNFTGLSLIKEGDADYALAWSHIPYAVQIMWEGYPVHNDFYLVDMLTGESQLIKKDVRATPRVSPEGKFIYWFNAIDTTWNTYEMASSKTHRVTSAKLVQVANELYDVPAPAYAYGIAGWLKEDEAMLVYDRFDIWQVDPTARKTPMKLTIDGRDKQIQYRLVRFDNQVVKEDGIDPKTEQILHGHNIVTREDSYFETSFRRAQTPKLLLTGSFKLSEPIKAKDNERYVFTQENFQQFPNLRFTDNSFKTSKQVSELNAQQGEFAWGTIELYSWYSTDGRKLEGLLAKPANFDPNKKYPMIVNFYEKSSQELYDYKIPEAHRSTVDYHYYTSNGYLVFNPDVYYDEGYPGEDAEQCVLPGVTALIKEGFVDANHIAAQGHSWGGYQVAHLATRTNIFAAIESGAPVVNMFSAYGGIRKWTGSNRSFQYEHGQSRIGKSIWEAPLRYLDNSPLFWADKINTPLLIMHNTNDGAVPFSQGVEFFIALRRLQKPAWMLNYNEADHWPTKVRDKYDFQIRMAQFFDHYLKDKPMPKWMEKGIPATQKGKELGLELE
jgi:dipeptidyl aminopeptidase/acylaminoacyl peptidase